MALSPEDPHSYARPDLVAVPYINLDLCVNFERNVLSGLAILSVCKIHTSCEEIVLDTFGLNIYHVRDFKTGAQLEYDIGRSGLFGSKFTIKIPNTNNPESLSERRITIVYETSPFSPALYWLTPEQTSDGTHPLLISNSKLTFARAIFPCQDTPSIKFTLYAQIRVLTGFNVMMSGQCVGQLDLPNYQTVYDYHIENIPSYAMVLVVGLLEVKKLGDTSHLGIQCFLWAEKKYIEQSTDALMKIIHILETVKKLDDCDFNICVLPPTVPEFDLQCSGVTFLSPTLLNESLSSFTSSVSQNILESCIGNLVPIGNFEHLWLLKSISTFIYRKIISNMDNGKTITKFLEEKGINDLKKMLNIHGDVGLVPDLKGILPKNIIKYVPYEKGYWLLNHLQQSLGGLENFLTFLKYYIKRNRSLNHAKKCWNTDGFKKTVDIYFYNKIRSQPEVDWNEWFHGPQDLSFYHLNSRIPIIREIKCHVDAEQWLAKQPQEKFITMTIGLTFKFDLEKMEFLAYLHASPMILPIDKLRTLQISLMKNQRICDIRFLWLRLCIKSKWFQKVTQALEFACEYCTPKYASPIFRDLYEWTESRNLAISWFQDKYTKMVPETRIELKSILNLEAIE